MGMYHIWQYGKGLKTKAKKFASEIVQKALKWPMQLLQYLNCQNVSRVACPWIP